MIERIAHVFGPQNLTVVSVAMNSSEAELSRWFQKFNKPELLVNVEDQATRDLFGIPYIPQIFLVDTNGILIGKYTTDIERLEKDIEKVLKR